MKKQLLAFGCVLLLAPALTGCSFSDIMLYLYGGDDFIKEELEPVYTRYEAPNGVTVVYDTNVWGEPMFPREDTLALASGGSIDATNVMFQVTDVYEDFLAQSGAELSEETPTVEYELSFEVPDADVAAVRYDCGSYQTIFAEIQYDAGLTVYITAATRLSDYEPIIQLLQTSYPTGATPESAADIPLTA